MNRRHLIAGLFAATLQPGLAWAQGYADQIVSQLRRQGYSGISVTSTWLGRTRILGQSAQGTREIIIDPRTGEILRDLFTGGDGAPRIVDDSVRQGDDNSGHGNGGNNEPEEPEEPEHENGGGGGGNSGTGGGGGGDSDSDDDDDDDDSDDD